MPHCTLVQGLALEQVPTAVQASKRLRPTAAQVAGVGMVNTDTGAITTVAEPPHSSRAD